MASFAEDGVIIGPGGNSEVKDDDVLVLNEYRQNYHKGDPVETPFGYGVVMSDDDGTGTWTVQVEGKDDVMSADELRLVLHNPRTADINEPPFPEQDEVKCPNCGEATSEHVCPACQKDLTPEWNTHGQQNEFFDTKPDFNDANEFWTWPQNVPKRNQERSDDSFPSMSLSKVAAETALWDDIFTDSTPTRSEVGKWIMDTRGQLHYEQGMQANHERIAQRDGLGPTDQVAIGSVYNDGTADVQKVFAQDYLDLNHIEEELQRIFGPIKLQPPVGLGLFSEKGEVFVPFDIMGGQWFIPPYAQTITGTAWVKERPNGIPFESDNNHILVVEHLQDDDFMLFSQGVKAIITAVGGAASHAAYLAMTQNIPVIVGIGDSYNKLETGNYVKIDPQHETIAVMPGATNDTPPEQKQQIWNNILDYQRQRGGSVKKQFSHVIEELDWKEANSPNLEECPECSDPMIDQGSESVCHGCGHKQPIIVTGGAVAALPIAAEALGGGEAAGAAGGIGGIGGLMTKALRPGFGMGLMMGRGGGGGGGDNSGGSAAPQAVPEDPNIGTISKRFAKWDMQHTAVLSEIWELIQNALKSGTGALSNLDPSTLTRFINPLDPVSPLSYIDDAAMGGLGATHQQLQQQLQQATGATTFGEEEIGTANKNDGTNSTDEASDSGTEGKKEQGDGPEQLKDVDGGHGSQDSASGDNLGDPHLQDKALKAFHMNLPLVIEFSESDEAGADHPILQALDALLEESFPGYKDGFDEDAGGTTEHPEESETPEERDESIEPDAKSEGADKKESAKIASVWHYAWDGPDIEKTAALGWDSMPYEPPTQFGGPPSGPPTGTPTGTGGPAIQICQRCGQAHPVGTPCPVADVTTGLTTGTPVGGPVGQGVSNKVVTKWRLAMPSNEPVLAPQQAAGAPAAPSICPMCSCSHMPGTPCPTYNQPQGAPPSAGNKNLMAPVISPGVATSGYHVSLFDEVADDDSGDFGDFDDSSGDSDYHSDDDWTDDSGSPLQEGVDYEMKSAASPIPDRVTIEQILPEKLTYILHSGDIDFRDTITRDQLDLDGASFTPVDWDDTGEDSTDTFSDEEMPVRPGQDALPQEDDLSSPSTVVSSTEEFAPVSLDTYTGSFHGDKVVDRTWLIEDSSPVAVDPIMMAKFAGKDFSPREQREFIDERGEARNLDRLDLSGTHYIDEGDLGIADSLW